ncbi:hypothetical protein Ancab_019096 [Ancistrocladus abbreviatus]
MEFKGRTFGAGPKELCGAIDLISHYKLWHQHEIFCKRSLPLSISGTHYLHRVVGDAEIRKGDGMQLDQLFQNVGHLREKSACLQPFGLDVLMEAFHIRQATPADLSSAERGSPTEVEKLERRLTEKNQHKKHKHRDKEKDRDQKKRKHRHADGNQDNIKVTKTNGARDGNPSHLKHQRRH